MVFYLFGCCRVSWEKTVHRKVSETVFFCRFFPFLSSDVLCRLCFDIIRFPLPYIFKKVMINSDLITARGDSRTEMDSGPFYWCLYPALQSLHIGRHSTHCFWFTSATCALERSLLYWVQNAFYYISPLCVLKDPTYSHPGRQSIVIHSPFFSPHTSLSRIHIMITFLLWDTAAISQLCASGVCDVWVIFPWRAYVWLLCHSCNERLLMCSQGPHNAFTRNIRNILQAVPAEEKPFVQAICV